MYNARTTLDFIYDTPSVSDVWSALVSCLSVSLLVVTAGRGDCTERERKAGERESKAWMDKATKGDGTWDRRNYRGRTWRRTIATSLHTRGAQSHPLWLLFSTRKILAFLGRSVFTSCYGIAWCHTLSLWNLPSLGHWIPFILDNFSGFCEVNQ